MCVVLRSEIDQRMAARGQSSDYYLSDCLVATRAREWNWPTGRGRDGLKWPVSWSRQKPLKKTITVATRTALIAFR